MVGLPVIGFVVVSCSPVCRPTFESAATLLCRAGFPAEMRTLSLGHVMPKIRLDVVISLLDKWWACSAAVAALLITLLCIYILYFFISCLRARLGFKMICFLS